MKVCFFGIYNPEYSRNKILISGLKENGVEVVECRVEPSVGKIKKYTELIKKFSEIRKSNFDFVVVGFPGHSVVWLAYLLFGGRQQIIFDAFVSLYNSNVEDRQKYSPLSWRAFKDWFLDWFGCNLADTILLDTDEQIKYFVKRFGLRKDKFKRVFVGSDDNLFYPLEKKENLDKFVVHFHGSFIPLQGVEYIIKSAKILDKEKEVVFNIIGGGQEYQKMRKLAGDLKLKNLNFIDKVPYNKLVEYINNADVCLGIFGTTPKTNIVIPNKVFEALACGKAIITANTPAIRELLTDKENAIFCKAGDEKDLAEKILFLKKDKNLREKLAQNSRQLFVQKLTPRIIVKELLETIKN